MTIAQMVVIWAYSYQKKHFLDKHDIVSDYLTKIGASNLN